MDYNRIYLVGQDAQAVEVDLLGRYQECFDTATKAFVDGVHNKTPFETDRMDNLQTLRLMESVYIAAGIEVCA